MEVTFRGGPLDGRQLEIADEELENGDAIFWPSEADLGVHVDPIPGDDGVVEYRYRGDGTADYVAGLLEETP